MALPAVAGAAGRMADKIRRGAIDGVVESDVNILDIAALVVIVREAGGVFTDLEGGEIGLGTTSVLAAAPGLYDALKASFVD